jgi:hypothetical protein
MIGEPRIVPCIAPPIAPSPSPNTAGGLCSPACAALGIDAGPGSGDGAACARGDGPNGEMFVWVFACSQGCCEKRVAGDWLTATRWTALLRSVFVRFGVDAGAAGANAAVDADDDVGAAVVDVADEALGRPNSAKRSADMVACCFAEWRRREWLWLWRARGCCNCCSSLLLLLLPPS